MTMEVTQSAQHLPLQQQQIASASKEEDFWSDEISIETFCEWLDVHLQQEQQVQQQVLDSVEYERAHRYCRQLLSGQGVPKTFLVPHRRRFAAGVPLNNLRLNWQAIVEAAQHAATLYGGQSAAGLGGLLWCTQRLRLYKEHTLKGRLTKRRHCFYTFLQSVVVPPNRTTTTTTTPTTTTLSLVDDPQPTCAPTTMLDQRGILHLIAQYVGIQEHAVCSDRSCCAFSSCQVLLWTTTPHHHHDKKSGKVAHPPPLDKLVMHNPGKK